MLKNKITTSFLFIFQFIILVFITSSCKSNSSEAPQKGPVVVEETPFCTTDSAYSVTANVTGNALFYKRGLKVTKTGAGPTETLSRLTLSGSITTPLPIRFAEIRILNSQGQVVQCGKTDASGLLKALDGVSNLKAPAVAGTYTVQVLARSNHVMNVPMGKLPFQAYFSIKSDFYSNEVYMMTSTIDITGTAAVSTNLLATANENVSSKIEGGAFNIYNNIITSYDYLASNTSTQDLTCLSTKLSGYWKAGFNPGQYIYPESDPGSLGTLSFYLKSANELYINGGKLGIVSTEDTDHFDDSVIIHELGHHIENVCGTMESPGGSHSGASRIDPRLAWSEGWGNFFAAHILKNKMSDINPELISLLPQTEWHYYFDSEGYTDGAINSGYEYIKINLARIGNGSTSETLYTSGGTGAISFDPVSSSTNPGEGHFREIAISRGLYKITNTCSAPFANCSNTNNFSDIWKSFEKTSTGMGQSIYPFRSSIRLLERFKAAKGGSISAGLNTILATDEALNLKGDLAYTTSGYLTWPSFGIKLVPSGSVCNLKIIPKSNIGSSAKSDQRYSNHFYYIDKNALPGVTTINLSSSKVVGQNIDIDALLFNENYSYTEDCSSGSCSKSTNDSVVVYDRSTSTNKSISISSLSNGLKYLLNIRAYVSTSILTTTEYTYTITDQSGGYLCPSSTF